MRAVGGYVGREFVVGFALPDLTEGSDDGFDGGSVRDVRGREEVWKALGRFLMEEDRSSQRR